MVHYLVLICLNFCFLGSYNNMAQSDEINYIHSKDIHVSSQIRVGSSETTLKEAFGVSDSIIKFFDPLVDEVPMYYHFYGKSYFKIEANEITAFEIIDNKFNLLGLKVGSPIKELEQKFPASFSKKYSTSKNGNKVVRIGIISDNGIKSDAFYIVFRVDSINIVSIAYWENP